MGIFRSPIIGSRNDTRNCTAWQKIFPSKREVHIRHVYEQLLEVPTRKVSTFSQKDVGVELSGMDRAVISSFIHPIGTDGLISCVAFAIIDTKNGVHSVGHTSPLTIIRDFLAFLEEFSPCSSVFLRRGPLDYNVLSRVYDVFLRARLLRITLVEPGSTLVAFGGEVFSLPPDQPTRSGYVENASSVRVFGPARS